MKYYEIINPFFVFFSYTFQNHCGLFLYLDRSGRILIDNAGGHLSVGTEVEVNICNTDIHIKHYCLNYFILLLCFLFYLLFTPTTNQPILYEKELNTFSDNCWTIFFFVWSPRHWNRSSSRVTTVKFFTRTVILQIFTWTVSTNKIK